MPAAALGAANNWLVFSQEPGNVLMSVVGLCPGWSSLVAAQVTSDRVEFNYVEHNSNK